MSKGYNKNGLFVDVGLLRDHISKLREEKKLAQRLYDNVVAMRNYGDPSMYGQYRAVLRDVEQLIEYFDRMAKVLSDAEVEAVRLSRTVGARIKEDTDRVRHTSSHAFML